jgi:hypothetical protein
VTADPLARRLAACALALSLLALVLAGWGALRAEDELHALRRAVERATGTQRGPSRSPPPTLDPGD